MRRIRSPSGKSGRRMRMYISLFPQPSRTTRRSWHVSLLLLIHMAKEAILEPAGTAGWSNRKHEVLEPSSCNKGELSRRGGEFRIEWLTSSRFDSGSNHVLNRSSPAVTGRRTVRKCGDSRNDNGLRSRDTRDTRSVSCI
jgi:hypothetical protein